MDTGTVGFTSPGCRSYLVSDLHGNPTRYHTLFRLLREDPPDVLFMAGDLLPSPVRLLNSIGMIGADFVNGFLLPEFVTLQRALGERTPRVFVILGNDDVRFEEASVMAAATRKVWTYAHNRRVSFGEHVLYGYSCIPPSPFRNKDWERYDVSRYVDPGCVSPEEGTVTIPVAARDRRYRTIARDLHALTGTRDLSNTVMLFHAPPYETALDRADLDGQTVEGVPLDVHVGSIAIRRFIEQRQPLVTLHGHVHESYRLTGQFTQQLGRTWCLSAAHEGPELVVVDFELDAPGGARRRVL